MAFSVETEVLTETGFQKVPHITSNVKLPIFDLNTLRMEITKPYSVQICEMNNVLEFEGEDVFVSVSPTHTMITRIGSMWEHRKANEITPRMVFCSAGKFAGQSFTKTINGVEYSTGEYAMMQAAYIGARNISYPPGVREHLEMVCGKNILHRKFTTEVKNLPRPRIRDMLQILEGGCCHRADYQYIARTPIVVNDLQELIAKTNRTSRIKSLRDRMYQVKALSDPYITVRSINEQSRKAKGWYIDANIDIVIRCNGKVSIQGAR